MKRLTLCSLVVVLAAAGFVILQWQGSAPSSGSAGEHAHTKKPADDVPSELAPEKQQAIWDSEHATFEIETHLGERFVDATKSRSVEHLAAIFVDDLNAEVLNLSEARTRVVGPLKEWRSDAAVDERVSVRRSELADWLIESLEPFETIERGRLRVLQIHEVPEHKHEWNVELFWTADGTAAEGASVTMESHHHATVRYAVQTDLMQGATVKDWRVDSRTVRVSNGRLLTEVTSDVGLDQVQLPDNWNLPVDQQHLYNFQMAVEDFDRDGFPDIAVASGPAGLRPFLLKSDRGLQFTDITEGSGLKRWYGPSGLVSWIDYDNDGYPDLIMGDRLYHNQQGQSFKDVTAESGLLFGFNPMGCSVADFDADGLLDLYIIYQITPEAPEGTVPWVGDHHSGARNRLWHNDGNGRFHDVTAEAHADAGNRESMAVSSLFYDDDVYPDLYIANDFGRNVLLRNLGNGSFEDVSEQAGCSDYATSMGVSSGDLDNDGIAEIYVANMYSKMGRRIIGGVSEDDYPPGVFEQITGSCAGNTLYHRTSATEPFLERSHFLEVNGVGWAFATAMADFNGDGLLDLYGATGYRSFQRREPDG